MLERVEKVFAEWAKKLAEDWIHRRGFLAAAVIFATFLNLGLPAIIIYGVVMYPSFGQFLVSFCPEAVGIAFTAFVLNRLAKRREQQALKAQLMRRIRGSVRDIAVAAIDELKDLHYFDKDKVTLVGADLRHVQWAGVRLMGVNLSNADMRMALLKHATLREATLKGTNFAGAILDEAELFLADLRQATLWKANLHKAVLTLADLSRAQAINAKLQGALLMSAILFNANLSGADLTGANMTHAYLNDETRFSVRTTLPDGTNWTPDADMARFIDPDHPNFRNPVDPDSSAY